MSEADTMAMVTVRARVGCESTLREALGRLGLAFVPASVTHGPHEDAVAFRIPRERLTDVVLALDWLGFTDVRGYEP